MIKHGHHRQQYHRSGGNTKTKKSNYTQHRSTLLDEEDEHNRGNADRRKEETSLEKNQQQHETTTEEEESKRTKTKTKKFVMCKNNNSNSNETIIVKRKKNKKKESGTGTDSSDCDHGSNKAVVPATTSTAEYDDDAAKDTTKESKGVLQVMEDIVGRVLGYLPPQQQRTSCRLVSKLWNHVITTGRGVRFGGPPITLRIEDIGIDNADNVCSSDTNTNTNTNTKNNRFKRRRRWGRRRKQQHGDEDDDNNDRSCRNIHRVPLHKVGKIPSWVAEQTTTLILVLKPVKDYTSEYDLNDFCFEKNEHNNTKKKQQSYFLDRFPLIEDLTIYTEFAFDMYVSILSTTINRPLVHLKRIRYEETNVSNWRITHLKTFARMAPNLESLILRENMHWRWKGDDDHEKFLPAESIQELLPLSKSLQELVLFNRLNVVGNFEEFVSKMPLLKSWDVSCNNSTNISSIVPDDDHDNNNNTNDLGHTHTTNNSKWVMGSLPSTYRREKPQSYLDNSYRGYDLNSRRGKEKNYIKFVKDEAEFIVIMQDVIVRWFVFGLDDIAIHPWVTTTTGEKKNRNDRNNHNTNTHIHQLVRYMDVLIEEYFGNPRLIFNRRRPDRPYGLPKFDNLLLETTGHGRKKLNQRNVAGIRNGGGGNNTHKYSKYCSSYSTNKVILSNYEKAIRPCIKLYHKEFNAYLRGNAARYKYNAAQRLYQRCQVLRLANRISHVYDDKKCCRFRKIIQHQDNCRRHFCGSAERVEVYDDNGRGAVGNVQADAGGPNHNPVAIPPHPHRKKSKFIISTPYN